ILRYLGDAEAEEGSKPGEEGKATRDGRTGQDGKAVRDGKATECGKSENLCRAEKSGGERRPEKTAEAVREIILRHAKMELAIKGEYTAVREMRKHIAWYTAGYPNSAALRRRVNEIESFEKLEEMVEEMFREA
ncbi:MAG: tRNA-dihydrouridine synthase, partial [Lachnospiraceae bacterium]|nr:tRNA-dihydrouridine synthase [Lachnospiraceae bacterium]